MKSLKQLEKDMKESLTNLIELEKNAARNIGIVSVKYIKTNFDRQGYEGEKWKNRSPVTNAIYDSRSGVKGSVYNSKNPILLQTGNLRNSINYKIDNKTVFIGTNLNQVPYAKLHNEGGFVEFRGKMVYVPKRKYLGFSKGLEAVIKIWFIINQRKALKKFSK